MEKCKVSKTVITDTDGWYRAHADGKDEAPYLADTVCGGEMRPKAFVKGGNNRELTVTQCESCKDIQFV